MNYDTSIDMSLVMKDRKSFVHDRVIITNHHSIYSRTGKVRRSLPYQGIASRALDFIELSIVENPPDPKCIITKIIESK